MGAELETKFEALLMARKFDEEDLFLEEEKKKKEEEEKRKDNLNFRASVNVESIGGSFLDKGNEKKIGF